MKKPTVLPNGKQRKPKAAAQSVQSKARKVRDLRVPYFSSERLKIFNENFIDTDVVPNECIDLIVTSPPYNVDISYRSYHDELTYAEYLEFSAAYLQKCYQLAKREGRLCLNIPLDKNKGGQQSVGADVTIIAKKIGWKYHSTIIWNEQNISRRTAWGSWLSASAPYVIAPVELIVVLYKDSWKKTGGSKQSDITKQEFLEWTNGVWKFNGESGKRIGHPAPFPLELPRRCIRLFSYVDDVVLDPFLGSGTTLVACEQTRRKGIGFEIDSTYCRLAHKRIRNEGASQLGFGELSHKESEGEEETIGGTDGRQIYLE